MDTTEKKKIPWEVWGIIFCIVGLIWISTIYGMTLIVDLVGKNKFLYWFFIGLTILMFSTLGVNLLRRKPFDNWFDYWKGTMGYILVFYFIFVGVLTMDNYLKRFPQNIWISPFILLANLIIMALFFKWRFEDVKNEREETENIDST